MSYDISVTMSAYVDSLESIFLMLEAMYKKVPQSLQVSILLAIFGNVNESPYGIVGLALQTFADDELTWESDTVRLLQEFFSQHRKRHLNLQKHSWGRRRYLRVWLVCSVFDANTWDITKWDCNVAIGKLEHGKMDYVLERKNALMDRRGTPSLRMLVDSGASSLMVGDLSDQRNLQSNPDTSTTIGNGTKRNDAKRDREERIQKLTGKWSECSR